MTEIVEPSLPWNQNVEGDAPVLLINSNEPNLRVQAGPGTGKSYCVKKRVLRLLHPMGLDLCGDDVLIVAFNRVIARNLKEDIEHYLEEADYEGKPPVIRTVHALCLQAIGQDIRLLLPHERNAMLYDVLEQYPGVKHRYPRINKAEQALSDHEAKHEEHTALWQAVKAWLDRHDARLISDLPALLLDTIQLGDDVGNTYAHVIVDEFQDLTPGEQKLFTKIRAPGGSFLALGDSKQSIYRFRGNDLSGLANLEALLGGAVTNIPFAKCRRCPPDIVEAANRLMALFPPPLLPGTTSSANIHVVQWETYQAEAAGMAKHIVTNIKANPDDSHLAMVTRRRFGYMLRDRIKELDPDLSVDLSFSESLLESWSVRESFLYFCVLADPDAVSWRAWFSYQNSPPKEKEIAPKRNAQAYLQFLSQCENKITDEAVRKIAEEPRSKARGQGGSILWDRAKRYVDLKEQLPIPIDANDGICKLFNADIWLTCDDATAANDMELLLNAAQEMVAEILETTPDRPPEEILAEVAKRLRYMIATREPFEPEEQRHLQITTPWGAKGVTANHVYIMGLSDAAIPGEKRLDYPGSDEEFLGEQRRLFYVSLTRSTNTLVLSRALWIGFGEAKQLNFAVQYSNNAAISLPATQFLRDIVGKLPPAQSGEKWAGCES